MSGRVIFRADGNSIIGYGHFIRTLGIASLIRDDFYCIYATKNPTEYQILEIRKVCKEIISLGSDFVNTLRSGDIVVLDTYDYLPGFQQLIRDKGCKLVYIDDHIDKFYICDALINNIPGYKETEIKREAYTKLFLGIDYALLRKEFLNAELRSVTKELNKIFLSFGGADYLNLSSKIIKYLKKLNYSLDINLVVGDAFKNFEDVKKIEEIKIHKNLNAGDMASLMASSEMCITSASSLLNEAASIGSKLLTGYFADNQIKPYDFFIENDLAIGLGDLRNITFNSFKTQFIIAKEDNCMIINQYKKYYFQQKVNIRNLFYGLR